MTLDAPAHQVQDVFGKLFFFLELVHQSLVPLGQLVLLGLTGLQCGVHNLVEELQYVLAGVARFGRQPHFRCQVFGGHCLRALFSFHTRTICISRFWTERPRLL